MVLRQAEQLSAIDRRQQKLRNSVIADGVQVSGILFLTDMLVEQNIIDAICMADKLEELLAINIRLPKKMIDERIERYRTKG